MTRPVRHPAPANIGKYLAHIAKLLQHEERHDHRKTHCRCIECAAQRLAAHGWRASATGDGRGGGELTIVEAAAGSTPLFPDIDLDLARALRTLWASARLVEDKIAEIRRHGNDSEKVAGTGSCKACERFCHPRANPRDRLVAGLCPACEIAWRRWRDRNPDGLYPDFIRHRRKETEPKAVSS